MRKMSKLVRVMVGVAITGLVSVVVALGAGYPPQNMTVTTNTTVIIPSANPMTIVTRTPTTVVALGTYARVYSNGTTLLSQPLEFWCVTTGLTATTNLSNWGVTSDVTDGTVVWRPVNQDRASFTIVNDSTSTVYLAFGASAVVSKGIRINANGGSYTREGWRGEVQAIAGATNLNVGIQEE